MAMSRFGKAVRYLTYAGEKQKLTREQEIRLLTLVVPCILNRSSFEKKTFQVYCKGKFFILALRAKLNAKISTVLWKIATKLQKLTQAMQKYIFAEVKRTTVK